MTPIYARAGDTFFTRSESWLGKLIRWGETDKDEVKGSVWANHTGVVVEDGWIGAKPGAIVIEALWKTRRGPMKTANILVRVFRPIPAYGEQEMARFHIEATSYIGDRYGWWKLGGLLVDRVVGRKVVSPLFFLKGRPICSFLAAGTNDEARERWAEGQWAGKWPGFGVPWNAADPDTMLRFCESHPEFWEEVR
jgi:hypothetical protein